MPRFIETPAIVESAGNKPKRIEEFIGRVNSGEERLSVARMKSPAGWVEPGQTPQFHEYTLVLSGMVKVQTRDATHEVRGGQAFVAEPGEWVQYSTPEGDGAEYVAVCLPAFSMDSVHRDDES